jgi:hypothetical protein
MALHIRPGSRPATATPASKTRLGRAWSREKTANPCLCSRASGGVASHIEAIVGRPRRYRPKTSLKISAMRPILERDWRSFLNGLLTGGTLEMRKSLWILTFLFPAMGAPNAYADTITFGTKGPLKSSPLESYRIDVPLDSVSIVTDDAVLSAKLVEDFLSGRHIPTVFLYDFNSNSGLLVTDQFQNDFVTSHFVTGSNIVPSYEFSITYTTLTQSRQTVPEPSLVIPLLTALLAIAFVARTPAHRTMEKQKVVELPGRSVQQN